MRRVSILIGTYELLSMKYVRTSPAGVVTLIL